MGFLTTPTLVRFLTSAEVAERLGIHRKTFNKYFRLGLLPDFPQPRRVGNSSVRRWLSTEVGEWMERQPVAEVEARKRKVAR